MSKYIVEINFIEATEDFFPITRVLLWIFVLWWLYLAIYLLYFMLVLPFKWIYNGICEKKYGLLALGTCIYIFYIICIIVSSVQSINEQKKLHFECQDIIDIYYGEEFDYYNYVSLVKIKVLLKVIFRMLEMLIYITLEVI